MPYTLIFRRYAPFATFGGGFEGDNRSGASTSLKATARTIGAVEFAPESVGNVKACSSGTAYLGAGAAVAEALGRHYSKVTSSVAVATRTLDKVRFTAQTAGANPMVPGAPEIDTFVDFEAVFRGNAIEFSGAVRGDNFPNAEVFVRDDAGNAVMLLDFATSGGQDTGPMTRLAGAHGDQTIGTFKYRVGLDAAGRFDNLGKVGYQTATP